MTDRRELVAARVLQVVQLARAHHWQLYDWNPLSVGGNYHARLVVVADMPEAVKFMVERGFNNVWALSFTINGSSARRVWKFSTKFEADRALTMVEMLRNTWRD